MGPQRSRWRCPKRDGPGQIEELAVEIGFRFVNRMSHLATTDLSPGTTAIQRDSKCQGSKTSGTWNSTLRLFVPLLTTKAQWQQSISLGMRRIFETTFEPSHRF
ncbi:succinate dehydrogenase subunit 3 [Capsicum annuum]|nr:succinate dehydrogenase subunit 3 [Capsicum annuum]